MRAMFLISTFSMKLKHAETLYGRDKVISLLESWLPVLHETLHQLHSVQYTQRIDQERERLYTENAESRLERRNEVTRLHKGSEECVETESENGTGTYQDVTPQNGMTENTDSETGSGHMTDEFSESQDSESGKSTELVELDLRACVLQLDEEFKTILHLNDDFKMSPALRCDVSQCLHHCVELKLCGNLKNYLLPKTYDDVRNCRLNPGSESDTSSESNRVNFMLGSETESETESKLQSNFYDNGANVSSPKSLSNQKLSESSSTNPKSELSTNQRWVEDISLLIRCYYHLFEPMRWISFIRGLSDHSERYELWTAYLSILEGNSK